MTRTHTLILTVALLVAPAAAFGAGDEERRDEIRDRAGELFDELERMEEDRAPAPKPEPAPEPPPSATAPDAGDAGEPESATPAEEDDSAVAEAMRDVADVLEDGARSVTATVEGSVGSNGHQHHGHVHVEVAVETDAEREEALAEIEEFVRLARKRRHHQHQHRSAIRDLSAARAANDAAATVRREAEKEEQEPDLALDRRLRIGIDGQAATGPRFDRRFSVIGLFGGDLAFNLTRFLALGIGQVGLSWAGPEWTINAAPYVEGFFFIGRWLQPYAQVGVTGQMRLGGSSAELIGAAPFAAIGARFWLGSRFSVGPAARTYWVATDQFVVTDRILPRDTIIITGGFDCHLHF